MSAAVDDLCCPDCGSTPAGWGLTGPYCGLCEKRCDREQTDALEPPLAKAA